MRSPRGFCATETAVVICQGDAILYNRINSLHRSWERDDIPERGFLALRRRLFDLSAGRLVLERPRHGVTARSNVDLSRDPDPRSAVAGSPSCSRNLRQ